MRCIIANEATGTVIDGFTLCGGATVASSGEDGMAGVLFATDRHVYVYGCIVSNCVAQCGGGAFVGGTVMLSLVADCGVVEKKQFTEMWRTVRFSRIPS